MLANVAAAIFLLALIVISVYFCIKFFDEVVKTKKEIRTLKSGLDAANWRIERMQREVEEVVGRKQVVR